MPTVLLPLPPGPSMLTTSPARFARGRGVGLGQGVQLLLLRRRKLAHVAQAHGVEAQGAETKPDEAAHRHARGHEHSPDLALHPLAQGYPIPHQLSGGPTDELAEHSDVRGRRRSKVG